MRRGLIAADSLSELSGPVGYKNLAADLQSLSTIYLANWEKLADTTSVKQEEFQRAQQLSFYLFRSVGRREQSPALVAETADMRAGDADIICPSLFAGRSNGRIKPADNQSAKPANANDKPVTPSANPTPAPNANVSASATHTPDVSAKGPFVQ